MTSGERDPGDGADEHSTESPDELADRVDELESTVRDLRAQALQPPRGPFGLPRPPTPREFVEFTDRFAIPATVAFLEANIKALQAFQATLRMLRGADEARERTATARARTAELGSKTLDALDSALNDLKHAYEEGTLPDDPEARSVLLDAQRLTDEIRDELSDVGTTTGRTRAFGPRDELDATRGDATKDPRVDPEEVETELDVLRDEFGDETPDSDRTDESGDGDSGTGDDENPDTGAS